MLPLLDSMASRCARRCVQRSLVSSSRTVQKRLRPAPLSNVCPTQQAVPNVTTLPMQTRMRMARTRLINIQCTRSLSSVETPPDRHRVSKDEEAKAAPTQDRVTPPSSKKKRSSSEPLHVNLSPEQVRTSMKLCIDEVKKSDPEGYLVASLSPNSARAAAYILLAFDQEMQSVKAKANKNPMLGAIRIQWWRDTIEQAFAGSVVANPPIATVLGGIILRHKLPRRLFAKLLNARQEELDTEQPENLDKLQSSMESLVSSLLYLQLETLGVQDVNADHAASHIGKALGLTRLIRTVPFQLSRGNMTLPMDLTSKHGLNVERFQTENPAEEDRAKLKEVVFEVASVANAHLDHARELKDNVPSSAIPALLHAVPVSRYLDRLQKCDFDVIDPATVHSRLGPLPLQLSLLRHRYSNKY